MDPIGMEVFLCQFYRLEPKRHKEVAVTNSWAGLHNVSKFTQVRLVTCTCGRCLRSGIDTHSGHPSTSLQSINQRIQRTLVWAGSHSASKMGKITNNFDLKGQNILFLFITFKCLEIGLAPHLKSVISFYLTASLVLGASIFLLIID